MNQNPSGNEQRDEKSQLNGSCSATETAESSSFSSQNSPLNNAEEESNLHDQVKAEQFEDSASTKSPSNNEDLPDKFFKDPLLAILEQATTNFVKVSYSCVDLIKILELSSRKSGFARANHDAQISDTAATVSSIDACINSGRISYKSITGSTVVFWRWLELAS